MSFISDYVTPFLDYYGRLLDGKYLSEQLDYKGSKELGGDYVSKVRRSQTRSITDKLFMFYLGMTKLSLLFKILIFLHF